MNAILQPIIDLDEQAQLKKLGFDEGHRGVHTSRTMMFAELEVVMNVVSAPRSLTAVTAAVVEDNVVGKSTRSGRLNTATKLGILYSFDQTEELYVAFEHLWSLTNESRQVLALMLAISRDAVLRSTAKVIVETRIGEIVAKDSVYDVLVRGFASKYAETTLRSTSRNAMASWKQSGYLSGRDVPIRAKSKADYVALTFAVLISLMRGLKGHEVFESTWVKLLDMSKSELESGLQEANRHGLLTYRRVGEVIEIGRGPEWSERIA